MKERARKVLELTQKCAIATPEVLDGDQQEYTRESEEDKALMRRVASEAIVLLKNDGGLLPLKPKVRRLELLAPEQLTKYSLNIGTKSQEDCNRRRECESCRPERRRLC